MVSSVLLALVLSGTSGAAPATKGAHDPPAAKVVGMLEVGQSEWLRRYPWRILPSGDLLWQGHDGKYRVVSLTGPQKVELGALIAKAVADPTSTGRSCGG